MFNGFCISQSGRRPIELAALFAKRHDVEILFHATSPIPYMPDWSVDGIISFVKSERFKLRVCILLGFPVLLTFSH